MPEDDAYQKLKMKTHAESRRPEGFSHTGWRYCIGKATKDGEVLHTIPPSLTDSQKTRTTVC